MNKKATLALPLVLLVLLMVALLVSLGLFITKKMSKAELLADDFISMSAAEISDPEAGRSNIKSNILGESSKVSTTTNAGTNESSVKLKVICEGNESSNFDCYEKHYRELVKTEGIDRAFSDLRNRYKENGYVVSQCHPLTHIIGQAAIEKYPTAAEAYMQGDTFCWSGYYHGVLEGIMGKIGQENIIPQMNDICAKIPGKENYSFDYYNCVHGLGHGLMAMTNTELFESLKLCDNLKGGWEQTSCYGGVYMENVIVDNKNHFTKYLRPEDPLYPCNAVEDKYKRSCYLMQTSYMLKVTNRDFAKVFSLCATADVDFIDTCYQSLGRDASGGSVSNVSATKSSCDLGKDFNAKLNCIIGAVKDFVAYHHSDVQAKELCNSFDADDLQSICLSTAESYYKSF